MISVSIPLALKPLPHNTVGRWHLSSLHAFLSSSPASARSPVVVLWWVNLRGVRACGNSCPDPHTCVVLGMGVRSQGKASAEDRSDEENHHVDAGWRTLPKSAHGTSASPRHCSPLAVALPPHCPPCRLVTLPIQFFRTWPAIACSWPVLARFWHALHALVLAWHLLWHALVLAWHPLWHALVLAWHPLWHVRTWPVLALTWAAFVRTWHTLGAHSHATARTWPAFARAWLAVAHPPCTSCVANQPTHPLLPFSPSLLPLAFSAFISASSST
jgi:hypothetical protein